MDLTGMEVDLVSVKNSNPKIFEMIKEAGCGLYKIEKRSVDPLRYFIELISFMRKRKYDVIHAHGSSSLLAIEMLAAKIAGCKVRIAHSRNTKCNHRIIDKFLRPLFYTTYTHGFACGSDAGKWLFGDRKFLVLKNGKDLERYSFNENIRREVRSKYNWTDKIVLGHVGNFNGQKNHMFLTEVFIKLTKKNSKYVLVMMGDGHIKTLVEKKIQEAGLSDKCFFLGSVTNVNELLQGMDIMLLPSLFEGLPNVVLEWQAAGLPCIISDTITQECKITELVKYMPLSAGPLAWSEAVIDLEQKDRKAQSSEAIKNMQQAGYDINENAKELKKIYSSLVNGTE
jgi:glycosyltransferase involved in cell wall biosynthesis